MKKKFLFVAAIAAGLLATTNANAQDMKPAGGEKNIEVNFTPLGGSPISINDIRFRYFSTSDMAIRVGFSVTSSRTKTPQFEFFGTDNEIELTDKSSTFGFSIAPGIEKHFEGTEKLSPYVGAEIRFASVTNKDTDEELVDPLDVNSESFESETKGGSTTIGLNFLIGADWYFSKHIYMGTEVGFGFANTKQKDDETTNPGGPDTDTFTSENGSSFNLGPNFNSAIRLGFLF